MTHHFGSGVQDLHLIEDSGAVVSDGDVSLPILDLQHKIIIIIITFLNYICNKNLTKICRDKKKIKINKIKITRRTILSMPLGPRLVLMASATAVEQETSHGYFYSSLSTLILKHYNLSIL